MNSLCLSYLTDRDAMFKQSRNKYVGEGGS